MALSYHRWLDRAAVLFFLLLMSYSITARAVGRGGKTAYGKTDSKGTCSFCHGDFSKSAMTRYLETCEQKAITEEKAGRRQKAQQTRKLHLVVEGRDLPMYWMHLEVTASTTLTALDLFLRNTWLECCGYLSAFEIEGVRYAVDAGMYDDWIWARKTCGCFSDSRSTLSHTAGQAFPNQTPSRRDRNRAERAASEPGQLHRLCRDQNPPMCFLLTDNRGS